MWVNVFSKQPNSADFSTDFSTEFHIEARLCVCGPKRARARVAKEGASKERVFMKVRKKTPWLLAVVGGSGFEAVALDAVAVAVGYE